MLKKLSISLSLIFILASSCPVLEKTSAEQNIIMINSNVVNIRSGPGYEFNILKKAYRGQNFSLMKEEKDWVQIELGNGNIGWVANWLVTNVNSDKTINNEVKQTAKIIVNNLRVRKEPNIYSEVIGIFNKNVEVEILQTLNEWIKVETPSGQGYIAKKFVEIQISEENLHKEVGGDKKLIILHERTNIRSGPDVSYEVIEKAQTGQSYPIIETKNNWYKIRLSNGEIGYVAGWIVSIEKSLSSKKPDRSLKDKTIVIDPGHGGVDKGATSLSGFLEKKMTLETAQLLMKQLKASGANVILSRNSDIFLSLSSRVNLSTTTNADAFISLHFDSNLDSSVNGMTTYYFHSYQKPLAIEVHSALSQLTMIKDRGVRFGDYHVLRENSQKAVLLELGYLSHPAEEKIIATTHYQSLVADAIFLGLERYFSK